MTPTSGDNTDSLEIISAEASGILPSSTSLLSDTQIKEAVDWYTNRLKEKEVIKAHQTLTSFLPEGSNDIKEGRENDIEEGRVQTNAPVALKDRSVTRQSQELNASTTSISKTSLSHVTEKHDASDVVVQSQKMVTGSNTATKRGKFRLKRLETNPVKSCGNDLSFQSLNEQSVETGEEIKVTKGKDKSPTVKNLSVTDAHVDESDKTLSETKVPCDDGAIKEKRLESKSEKVILSEKSVETNADGLSSKEKYDDLNKSVSKSNNTKHSDVDSVMKTQTAKIACDIETSNSLFMPDYQDTIQQSVDSVNNSFENETSGLTNETFTSMKSFQTIDETGFQTDVTENLLSPDILKTKPNAQNRTEDTNVSSEEHEMFDGETTVVDAADETTGAAAGETAEETQDETTDESDSESVPSDKTDSETDEKDDVLSLLASDEDASFLEDESEDDGLVGMG